jgi:hypothetical protein
MLQHLHFLVVDRVKREVIARTIEHGWMLPLMRCHGRVRAGFAIRSWMHDRRVIGTMIGQWLGRLTPSRDAIDWLAVAVAAARAECRLGNGCGWIPIDRLHSTPALIGYQQWAFDRVMATGEDPCVSGPFGSSRWLDEARHRWLDGARHRWLDQACHRWLAEARHDPVVYRAGPHEVVFGNGAGPDVFCKGLSHDRIVESDLTIALAERRPEAFAETLERHTRADGSCWWVTARCPGAPLDCSPTAERVAHAAAGLANTQARLVEVSSHICPALDLDAIRSWASATIGPALDESFDAVTGSNIARSWTPLDLDPSNVFIDESRVRFIDLDDSFFAPAPLAMAVLAARLRRLGLTSLCGLAYRVYETAWRDSGAPSAEWRHFERVAAVAEAYLAWNRALKMTERGEIVDVLDVVRDQMTEALRRAAHPEPRGSAQ